MEDIRTLVQPLIQIDGCVNTMEKLQEGLDGRVEHRGQDPVMFLDFLHGFLLSNLNGLGNDMEEENLL